MSEYRASVTDDVVHAAREAEAFLRSDPVQHNLILTLLEQRRAQPEPGRYGIAYCRDDVVGVSFQSPLTYHASVTPMPPGAIEPLVQEIATVAPDLPGVAGDAATTARFAGRWAELMKVPAKPVEGQRLYVLDSLQPPNGVPGQARRAAADDADVLAGWGQAFEREAGSPVSVDALREQVRAGLFWVWDDGGPVAMARYTDAIGGVARIGLVYTPPEKRGRGYASACTAATSQVAFDAGADRCVLYTDLENPVSNAIYRRLGYEPVGEQLRYEFTHRVATEASGAPDRSGP